jgi:hypothetical protein
MSWAWITGNLTEHEMKLEHGLELERIEAEEKTKRAGFSKVAAAGRERGMPLYREEADKTSSLRRLFDTIKGFNETIKNWKGM